MEGRFFALLFIGILLFGLDIYLSNGFSAAFKKRGIPANKNFRRYYLVFSLLLLVGALISIYFKLRLKVLYGEDDKNVNVLSRLLIISWIF